MQAALSAHRQAILTSSTSELKLKELENKLASAEANLNELSSVKLQDDWSKSYQAWSKWEEVECISEEIESERKKLSNIEIAEPILGHSHDRTEERKIFEMDEDVKIRFCEKHRAMGNYLFEEGNITKAANQYNLALSYYEYCFPDSEAAQNNLDELRRACLCNISLCYYKLGSLRQAIAVASQVLTEDPTNWKALFRRAQAYRELDEYDRCFADLTAANSIIPQAQGSVIVRELGLLKRQQKNAKVLILSLKPLTTITIKYTTITVIIFIDNI